MTLKAEQLVDLIRRHMPGAAVTAEDTRGDGAHFAVTVTCATFEGLGRIDQHRKVYAALSGHVADGSLHAVQLTTRTK
ncbi:MAG: BolA/IbaG family iron-sulfur metabolism protein [Bdellovibrionales bacterium]|jgi:acid stress-induced BolA-like protein IbaG/YrbA|nr:BolA/IbaG family iron-sulfur metabolism protein [Bdellovibrionales bacterium]